MTKLTTAPSIPRGLDLSRLDDATIGNVKTVAGGDVTHYYGNGAIRFGGDYAVSADGTITSGTVDSLSFSAGPKAVFTLTGLDIQGTLAVDLLGTLSGAELFPVLMAGADTITGSKWRDVLNGQGGDDVIRGGNSGDTIHGGSGNDRLLGETGMDMLYGGAGNDTLLGGYGQDHLSGGTGRDVLFGLGGDDTLEGGAGFDRLTGGNGDDAFVFRAGFGRDRVNDFQAGDKVVLADKFWTGLDTGKDLVKVYGEINADGDAALSFGNGNSVVFTGVDKLSTLYNAIEHIDFI